MGSHEGRARGARRLEIGIMTSRQRTVLRAVISAWVHATWYRAADHGERVTLASLHRVGLVERRARRSSRSVADAAHEYKPTEAVLTELREALARKRES